MASRQSEEDRIQFVVRPFQATDRPAVAALAERLTDGIAPWLDRDAFRDAATGWLEGSMDGAGRNSAVFVAALDSGECIGVVCVSGQRHFTGVDHAYIGELAVDASLEGHGIGRALVAAAEEWAREHDFGWIALETGAANRRALDFYQRQGYESESIRLTKILD